MTTLKDKLDDRTDLQKYLFIRGFLVTENDISNTDNFPFYGNWNIEKIGRYHFMTHNMMPKVHYISKNSVTFFLLGHSYNPFTMEYAEIEQLEKISDTYFENNEKFQDAVDELTGVFVLGWFDTTSIHFITDPSGMQSAYYGIVENNFLITSHPQIVGDIYHLETDEFIKELINYKFYRYVTGAYLPADLSKYTAIKRVVPNICFTYEANTITTKRFYPVKKQKVCNEESDYNQVIVTAADILKNNAELILKKWENPAISLTGGIDSNTTFAAANGHYDEYETFSYLSAFKETVDVDAAKKIADVFKTKHTLYEIPRDKQEIADFELKAQILAHNSGYIAPRRENELRKRIYLEEHCRNDVEVKSWVSETIRGACFHRYRRKTMPPLSPKLLRNLYKMFITNRSLAQKVDKLYAQYIEKFEYEKIPSIYSPADIQFSEVTWGSWGGTNISEMKYCFDITIPYNNRVFLDLLFRVPLEKRLSDQHHLDMKKYLNATLFDMNIKVNNMNETRIRAFFLNIIFTINSFLPF